MAGFGLKQPGFTTRVQPRSSPAGSALSLIPRNVRRAGGKLFGGAAAQNHGDAKRWLAKPALATGATLARPAPVRQLAAGENTIIISPTARPATTSLSPRGGPLLSQTQLRFHKPPPSPRLADQQRPRTALPPQMPALALRPTVVSTSPLPVSPRLRITAPDRPANGGHDATSPARSAVESPSKRRGFTEVGVATPVATKRHRASDATLSTLSARSTASTTVHTAETAVKAVATVGPVRPTPRDLARCKVRGLLAEYAACCALDRRGDFERTYDDAWLDRKLDGEEAEGLEAFVGHMQRWVDKAKAEALAASASSSSSSSSSSSDAAVSSSSAAAAAAADDADEAAASMSRRTVTKKATCDRCDGLHDAAACPHFTKGRDDHPDAQRKKLLSLGSDRGNAFVSAAEVIRQPGDGSCLFHSLAYGLNQGLSLGSRTTSATALRGKLMDWLASHEETKIADTPVSEWVKWDSGSSVAAYAARMRGCDWGGGIEMAAFANHFGVGVHVYERSGRRHFPFKRISRFDAQDKTARHVDVLYCGGFHYDALILRAQPVELADAAAGSPDARAATTATAAGGPLSFARADDDRPSPQQQQQHHHHHHHRASSWGSSPVHQPHYSRPHSSSSSSSWSHSSNTYGSPKKPFYGSKPHTYGTQNYHHRRY